MPVATRLRSLSVSKGKALQMPLLMINELILLLADHKVSCLLCKTRLTATAKAKAAAARGRELMYKVRSHSHVRQQNSSSSNSSMMISQG